MPILHRRVRAGRTPPGSITITTVGDTDWQVPNGITSVTLTAKGGATGAQGGVAIGTLPVTPFETLRVHIGGGTGGSANHGADVRQGGTGLANRRIVGGGSGNTGRNVGAPGPGGAGGAATGAAGGPGGGGTGGGGTAPTAGSSGQGGTGGTNGASVGGGGGGGYFGGGGGGAGSASTLDGAGGGGGSNYLDAALTATSSTQGGNAGAASVTISW